MNLRLLQLKGATCIPNEFVDPCVVSARLKRNLLAVRLRFGGDKYDF